MESAREKLTGEIVEAEMLWLLDDVDKYGYVCWGCGIDMYPSSWMKNSKKRPSFNKYPGKNHGPSCDADAEQKIINKGTGMKQSVRNYLNRYPGLSPSRLVLVEYRRQVSYPVDTDTQNPSAAQHSITRACDTDNRPPGTSRGTANTIRPICHAFINFPCDRNRPLHIPAISGDNYMRVFKKLSTNIQVHTNLKIFYSSLQWKKINSNNQWLIIPLTAGLWIDNKPSKNYQVHVDWASWSQAKRTMLLNELEIAQIEAKEAYPADKNNKAWVFFIGEQEVSNPQIFYVRDQRLICSIIGNIIYPGH